MPKVKNTKPAARAKTPRRKSQSPVPAPQAQTVPLRWLASMFGLVLLAAGVCGWLALCWMFWQGSWQLLYHPTSAVTRTPSSKGIAFDSVAFGAIATGQPSLRGWWIPAPPLQNKSSVTLLYLHGANGNIGDSVDMLATLHNVGVNILVFDYRGYGQSQFAHPSEQGWLEDTQSALEYLTGTRHIAPSSIVLMGRDLGANLAVEFAARHPELAALVVMAPLSSATSIIFQDPRAYIVPAHWLVKDRWELHASAPQLRIPTLWFGWVPDSASGSLSDRPAAFYQITAPRNFVWLSPTRDPDATFSGALSAWLADLSHQGRDLPPCLAGGDIPC